MNVTELIEKLRAGLNAVMGVIEESEGVIGLHKNGDVATWGDLQTGGRYEEWLLDFDDAVEASETYKASDVMTPEKLEALAHWLFDEAGCQLLTQPSTCGHGWAVEDAYGNIVAEGTTMVDAIVAGERYMVQHF